MYSSLPIAHCPGNAFAASLVLFAPVSLYSLLDSTQEKKAAWAKTQAA
jgi:hypothetical protein